MSQIILYTVVVTTIVGILSAIILYYIAKKFHVETDSRIEAVHKALPGVNCGGCGYVGCRRFAEACVMSEHFEKLFCPVGGNTTMAAVAKVLGKESAAKAPVVAVVRCSGSRKTRDLHSVYEGPHTCAVEHTLFRGETGCQYGCLWFGDCVTACKFKALSIDKKTGLPVVNDAKCIACGACVKACPRHIIEMRPKGTNNRRVFVSCVNEDKGGIAAAHCKVACIGCGKCVKECPFGAIMLTNNRAIIDAAKCKLCRKCVSVCPTTAIHEVNFPPRPVQEPTKQNKGTV